MKTEKLYYRFLTPELEEDREGLLPLYLQEGRGTSKWYSDLPSNISNYLLGKNIPSVFKFISFLTKKVVYDNDNISNILLHNNANLSSAKVCPAIHGILDNIILVTSPLDIQIEVFSTKQWQSTVSDPRLILVAEDHTEAQFATINPKNNIFKDKLVVKFKLPILIKTSGLTSWLFLQPQYHHAHPFQVLNGVITGNYTKMQPLNVVTTVDIPSSGSYSINIKKGDVLAYLWSPVKLKIEYNKNISNIYRSKFIRGVGGV